MSVILSFFFFYKSHITNYYRAGTRLAPCHATDVYCSAIVHLERKIITTLLFKVVQQSFDCRAVRVLKLPHSQLYYNLYYNRVKVGRTKFCGGVVEIY